jgi:chain length determinant protein tyrosine kinase EpsG
MNTNTLQHNTRSRSIGAILMDAGKLNPEDAERILRLQKDQDMRFGDAAISLGLLSEADIQFAVSHQFDYPYLAAGELHYSEQLVAAYQPFSKRVEELRALRSQLLLRWFETGHKTLAVIGVNEGQGCSYLAANLAIVFSQLGQHTLLVDANLRRPEQHELFRLGSGKGLSDSLAGRNDEFLGTRIQGFVDLSVLPAGTLPPNPQELLGRDAFSALVAECANAYDVVLMDTPPLSLGSDALTIASRAEGVLLVVRKHHTMIADIQKLTQQLQAAGAEIVGCVVNEF